MGCALAGEVLVLRDTRVRNILRGVVDDRHRLKLRLIERLVPELEAAVRQGTEAMFEICINRASEDGSSCEMIAGDLMIVDAGFEANAIVIKHVLEQTGESRRRHHLVGVDEVAVIGGGAGRDTRGDRLVQL